MMKFEKGALLFFVFPAVMLGIGFFAGIKAVEFFYPGRVQQQTETPEFYPETIEEQQPLETDFDMDTQRADVMQKSVPQDAGMEEASEEAYASSGIQEAASSGETLCVDTEYVLEETDIINHTVVETSWKLPDKYVGMNREQFLAAMESYEAFPPLSEMERGFVGLEVLSFSRERVVVQMNYQYLQPGSCFYLAVQNNEVVVYLEDMETIYINTGIKLDSLPEALQLEIIQMMWVEDEESLYDFLETYSS